MARRQSSSPSPTTRRKGVSEFIENTFSMVNECDSSIVDWVGRKSRAFAVKNEKRFTAQLSKFFRHSNFKSFVRQLNHYGFRKMRHDEVEPRPASSEWAVFYHSCFMKGREDLLVNIKQKRREADSEVINELRSEIDELRHQIRQIPVLQGQIKQLQHQVDSLSYDRGHDHTDRDAKRHKPNGHGLRVPAPPAEDYSFNRSGSDPFVIIRSISDLARMSSTESLKDLSGVGGHHSDGEVGSSPARNHVAHDGGDHEAAPDMCSRMTSLDVMKQILPNEARNPLVTRLPSNPFHTSGSSQTPPCSQDSSPLRETRPATPTFSIPTVKDPAMKLEADVVPPGEVEVEA